MKTQTKHRIGIRTKVIFLVCSSMLVIAIFGVGIGYSLGFNLLRKTVGGDSLKMAELLAGTFSRIVKEEIKDVKMYLNSPFWKEAIEEQNSKYETKSPEDVKIFLLGIDKQWLETSDDNSLVKEYLGNKQSVRLSSLVENDRNIAEIFLTDKEGGLIASSGKTSDFYQADEKWWQEAFDDGRGKYFIDSIQFDKSVGIFSINFALPIRNKNGEIIGICKSVTDLKRFLEALSGLKIGKTGHAVLVDQNNNVIFHREVEPMSTKFAEDKDFQKMRLNKNGWFISKGLGVHKKDQFVAYSNVDNPTLLASGMSWKVCIIQESDEIFAPLRKLFFEMLLVIALLILVAIPMGFIFASLFIRPVKRLIKGTEIIGKGDLDYKVDIRTNDEIEELADSFNKMAENLKETTTSIDMLSREIEARKKTEKALQDSHAKYKTIYNSSKDAIMLLMSGGKFVSGNPATIEMFGCKDEEEFISKTPAELSPKYQPDGRLSTQKAQEMMNTAMEQGSHSFEWKHKQSHGNEFFATVLLTRMELSGEKLLQATVRNITEKKKADEKIYRASEEWKRTFDSITDLVFIQDKDLTIIKANKIFADTLKMKQEDVIGRKCYELLHDRDKPFDNCPFKKTRKDKKPHTEEVDDPHIGIPLLVTTSPMFDEDGEFIGSVHIAKDITEQKKAEKLKDEFVSTVSHELRTPLSITKEGVSLVLDEIPGKINDKQKNVLKMSRDNMDRLARIIDDLLDVSKIEAGKIELKKAAIDMHKTIKDVYDNWKLESNKKHQKLECILPEPPVSVNADSDRMIEVLDNLISNAIKYTPDKGKIKIELKDNKEKVEISISDTGTGISDEDLPKVFDKFQQFGRTAGPGAKGTGLGLAIAKNLVEMHNGKLAVESMLKKGTKFIISLPKGL